MNVGRVIYSNGIVMSEQTCVTSARIIRAEAKCPYSTHDLVNCESRQGVSESHPGLPDPTQMPLENYN